MNQSQLAAHCSFIGLNDADFNSWCLSNANNLFSKILSPKKHSQVNFDKLRSPGFSPSFIYCNTAYHYHIYSHWGTNILSIVNEEEMFSTKLLSSFGVSYQKIRDVRIKRKALKSIDDRSFWSSEKCRK